MKSLVTTLAMLCLLLETSPASSARQLTNDLGIAQQDDATMHWYMDAKFGMFLHWGLYAVPAKGEWYMENSHMPPAEYRKYATDPGDGVYFDALPCSTAAIPTPSRAFKPFTGIFMPNT